jgi:putative transposase
MKIPPQKGAEAYAKGIAMPQSFSCLHYHLIFSTKGRAPFLVGDLPNRLYAYIGGIIRNENGTLAAAGGMPDHVHLLVSFSRESSVSDVLRQIKGSSSRWIHETIPDLRGFAWQAGYAAFAVSYSHIETVKQYIATQADHHRTVTFQEEFRAFLRRHELQFDERYLWD